MSTGHLYNVTFTSLELFFKYLVLIVHCRIDEKADLNDIELDDLYDLKSVCSK